MLLLSCEKSPSGGLESQCADAVNAWEVGCRKRRDGSSLGTKIKRIAEIFVREANHDLILYTVDDRAVEAGSRHLPGRSG